MKTVTNRYINLVIILYLLPCLCFNHVLIINKHVYVFKNNECPVYK